MSDILVCMFAAKLSTSRLKHEQRNMIMLSGGGGGKVGKPQDSQKMGHRCGRWRGCVSAQQCGIEVCANIFFKIYCDGTD